MRSRYDAVFVSPHLDDVVLSCPGHVLAERTRGASVLVLTLFSDGDDRADYTARRAEDRAALACLGVDGHHLDLFDAPTRRVHPPSFRSLILDRDPRDEADRDGLAENLRAVLSALDATRVYLPLGVGEHIDHRLAFDAASALSEFAVAFYEDRPYSLVEGAVRARLGTLANPAAYRAALETAPYVRAFLRDEAERERCLDALVTRAAQAPRDLQSSSLTLAAADQATALTAIACYGSQLRALFGEGARPATRVYDRERIWRATSAARSS